MFLLLNYDVCERSISVGHVLIGQCLVFSVCIEVGSSPFIVTVRLSLRHRVDLFSIVKGRIRRGGIRPLGDRV